MLISDEELIDFVRSCFLFVAYVVELGGPPVVKRKEGGGALKERSDAIGSWRRQVLVCERWVGTGCS